jgi:NADH-quinone oxidoreductase subunit J
MDLNIIALILFAISMVVFSLFAVLARSLIKAAICLAVSSVALTAMMFWMGAYIAAVFELSVCAGLITVIFISSVSLIKPLTHVEIQERTKNRIKKYIYLPIILVAVFILLCFAWYNGFVPFKNILTGSDDGMLIGKAIWENRQLDIFGQLIIILAGVFGVIILFKERGTK